MWAFAVGWQADNGSRRDQTSGRQSEAPTAPPALPPDSGSLKAHSGVQRQALAQLAKGGGPDLMVATLTAFLAPEEGRPRKASDGRSPLGDGPRDASPREVATEVAKADTQQVVSLLREYAQRTALRGGNPYRAKAYSRAADGLAALAVPLDVLIGEGRLTEIPGVGEAIADIVSKLHKTGPHPSLEPCALYLADRQR